MLKKSCFQIKQFRLVSRKLQKTRTSVMISSRMFGIFVINEEIENTYNLLKKRCLQSMIMSFAQVTTSNDHDDFHGVMATDEPWMMGSLSTDEWWVMTSVSTDEQSRTNTRSWCNWVETTYTFFDNKVNRHHKHIFFVNNLPKLGRVCVVNDFFWIQMMTKELFAVIILSCGAVNYT